VSATFDALVAMLRGRRVVALTGAGVSTDSGIPDYRGPDGLERKRPPVQYQEFMQSHVRRQRYWARSVVGWPRFSSARFNEAHSALARMEHAGFVRGIITQNVDGLHQAAGSLRVVELHGALARVRCTGCGVIEARNSLQERMLALNPGAHEAAAVSAPDGDAELDAAHVEGFVVAGCVLCDAVLKPDVVFFGENVPKPVIDEAWRLFDEAEVLLVAGTSLAVFSGYRFVRKAVERGVSVVIVNRGVTRGDGDATLKLDAHVGTTLTLLAAKLAE
jgi:NAD-dependent SIR2 family protein deacetylase